MPWNAPIVDYKILRREAIKKIVHHFVHFNISLIKISDILFSL